MEMDRVIVYTLLFLLCAGFIVGIVLMRKAWRDVNLWRDINLVAATDLVKSSQTAQASAKADQVMAELAVAQAELDTAQVDLVRNIIEIKQIVDKMSVANMPTAGFPGHMEAAWEDIGARGKFLTDLGGMSIDMREQMFNEFIKALNQPLVTEPAAGSIADILADLDAWLTKDAECERFLLTGHSKALGYRRLGDED